MLHEDKRSGDASCRPGPRGADHPFATGRAVFLSSRDRGDRNVEGAQQATSDSSRCLRGRQRLLGHEPRDGRLARQNEMPGIDRTMEDPARACVLLHIPKLLSWRPRRHVSGLGRAALARRKSRGSGTRPGARSFNLTQPHASFRGTHGERCVDRSIRRCGALSVPEGGGRSGRGAPAAMFLPVVLQRPAGDPDGASDGLSAVGRAQPQDRTRGRRSDRATGAGRGSQAQCREAASTGSLIGWLLQRIRVAENAGRWLLFSEAAVMKWERAREGRG